MYHAHFGLERGLFEECIAADAAVFRSAKHDQLIAHFKLAFASPSSAVVLRGPAGIGKTTLTAAALRTTSTRLALAWIDGTPLNAAELLELTLVELGIGTLNTTRIERLQLWRQFQAEVRATGSRLFLVVERTEDLSPEVLHALDQLTAPDTAGNPGANIVLLGNDGIDAHLAVPLLDSLRQRIRMRAELAPFTEAELQDYLRHQVACAGGHYDRIFAPGAVAALFRYSHGVARLANNLCEAALDIATVQRQKLLTADVVARTAVTLLGLAEPAPLARQIPAGTAGAPVAGPTPSAAPARPAPAALAAAPAARAAPVPRAPAIPAGPAIHAAPAMSAMATPPAAPTPAATPATAATPPPPPTLAAKPRAIAAAAPASAQAAPNSPSIVAEPPAAAREPEPVLEPRRQSEADAASAKLEYDGGATDVTDVALVDFPVLTDAVELDEPKAEHAGAAAIPATTAAAAAPTAPLPAARAPTPPPPAAASAKPAPKPASRVETAYAAPRPSAKPAAPAAPSAAASASRPASPDAEDADLLRQTQTMRAIAVAKSIDDISEIDAETLFSDAELDLVAAALASSAEWSDEEALPAAAAPATPAAAPAPAPAPASAPPAASSETPQPAEAPSAPGADAADDPFAFFGLGHDMPLELIDDSAQPPADQARKTAIR